MLEQNLGRIYPDILVNFIKIYTALLQYETEAQSALQFKINPDRPGINLKQPQLSGKHTVRQLGTQRLTL